MSRANGVGSPIRTKVRMPPQDGTSATWEHVGAFWPVGPASPDANSSRQMKNRKGEGETGDGVGVPGRQSRRQRLVTERVDPAGRHATQWCC